ncbi:hypothetical protein [Spirochaeta dissipatitropha]
MIAEKIFIDTDENGNVKKFPPLPPNKHIELIVLMDESQSVEQKVQRVPSQKLAGKMKITGDVFSSETAWCSHSN